jgi:hypothetical protein
MKIRLTFKTPDAVNEALKDVPEEDRDQVRKDLEKKFRWGEYCDVEYDTVTKEATVV